MEALDADDGLVGGRYRVVERVGRGGMAEVFRAADMSTGAVVALKCLLSGHRSEGRRARAKAHLEREYHTLCQLAHPRVVTVYDYGIDAARGPYYTMELLDGGDLEQQAELDYRTACSYARDVCSALSMLHARRVVHRDLSPRNVRCTSDGSAKLIDFGAMAAMGPSKLVVGTPPMCAPEIVRMQSLDARTDLYALGATLYRVLTKRHAYPATSFATLESTWQHAPPPPSAYDAAVPPALDSLVMDLLQLDSEARPASSAEVLERLTGIAGLDADELLDVSRAYLSTPRLVGREAELADVRRRAARLPERHGGSIVVEGAAGVGRTRMLDACMIEAKLAGAAVARADASDADGAPHGVMRTLVRGLLQLWPEAELPALGPALRQAWPELCGTLPDGAAAGGEEPGGETGALADGVQRELHAFILALCRRSAVALVVDDVQEIDEASLASLALLARETAQRPLLIATSVRRAEQASFALGLLLQSGFRVELTPLAEDGSEQLLRSMFGDVPHMASLAERLHRAGEGRPRDLVQLAQHLVDKRLVRYDAGAWSISEAIAGVELPQDMLEALVEQARGMSDLAAALGQAMVASDVQRFDLDECGLLSGREGLLETMRGLDELIAAGAVVPTEEGYAVRTRAWVLALRRIANEREPATHRRALARVFERRGDRFRQAQQLLLAGDEVPALDLLVAFTVESQARTDSDASAYVALLAALPADWLDVYEHALSLCAAHARPRRDAVAMLLRATGAVAHDRLNARAKSMYVALWEQLRHDCGLDLHAALDPALPEGERLRRALEGAQARYDALSESERAYAPGDAARQLARVVYSFIGVLVSSMDLELWRLVPSIAPLAPLSPALWVVQQILEGVGLRLQGRTEEARAIYVAVLERLDQPDRGGFEETYWNTARAGLWYVLSTLDAAMGLPSAKRWAQLVEDQPMYELNACHSRVLVALWQGETREAEHARARGEQLMMQYAHRAPLEGTHLLRELPAHAFADDLMQVKRALESIEVMAARFPAWQPVLCYARAEHARIRGDYAGALEEVVDALEGCEAGTHQIWPYAAATHARVLCALRRNAEAEAVAHRYLGRAEAARLGYTCHYIRLALALSEARLGKHQAAAGRADEVLAGFERAGVTGLNLLLAHETRARVALAAEDIATFERCCRAFESSLSSGESHVLLAKHRRLLREAAVHAPVVLDLAGESDTETLETRLRLALDQCGSSQEHAARMLELLLSETGTSQGFLYSMEGASPVLIAERADHELAPELHEQACQRLRSECSVTEGTTLVTGLGEDGTGDGAWVDTAGRRYAPVVVGHQTEEGFAVSGLALLVQDARTLLRHPALVATCLSRVAISVRQG